MALRKEGGAGDFLPPFGLMASNPFSCRGLAVSFLLVRLCRLLALSVALVVSWSRVR